MGQKRAPLRADAVPPVPPSLNTRALLACHDEALSERERHGPVEGQHPEAVGRPGACLERLRGRRDLWRLLRKVPRRRATDPEILLAHDRGHLDGLRVLAEHAASDSRPRFLPTCGPVCLGGPCAEVQEGSEGTDTYVTAGSLEAARHAIGGLLQLVDHALSAEPESAGLALCRPPGHHASRARGSGFCLLNNVAVAASYARDRYPDEVKRVLIFDWDVHHGQGTQQIFEMLPDVLVVNAHRHDGQNFYPASGSPNEVGVGPGKGYTINVALPGGYSGAALWAACEHVVLPAARAFKPDLILVSAGFDAAMGDPLGGCSVAPAAFGALATELRNLAAELCQGRLVLALEGGYRKGTNGVITNGVTAFFMLTYFLGTPFNLLLSSQK